MTMTDDNHVTTISIDPHRDGSQSLGSQHQHDSGVNISHYIDLLTQTQEDDSESNPLVSSLEVKDNADSRKSTRTMSSSSRYISADLMDEDLAENPENPWSNSESDGFDEDPEAAWRQFKGRKSLKRKAAAAETRKMKAAKTALSAGQRKGLRTSALPSNKTTRIRNDEDQSLILDDKVPEYIEKRKAQFRQLHHAGWRYPPYHGDIYFSDDDDDEESPSEEKPILPHVKPQRPREPIQLSYSKGVIPASIAQWLRDYQIEGVRFLHERFVEQRGAILGDDMGLGKTIQVIAFLTAAFGKTGTVRDDKLMRKTRRLEDGRWYPQVLIVCPGTLMQNWQDELNKWGWWQVNVYHGTPTDREMVLKATAQGRAEIMITTYNTYRLNHDKINTIDWDAVIADECHAIKTKDAETTKTMNKVNALCRIGLTGTAIQNKYEELWTLLNWANPGQYGTASTWKQEISIPLKVGQAHDATNEQLAKARITARELVETVLPGVFLRRMKTLIADQLPKKSDRVVFCQLTDTQAEAYQNLVDGEAFEYIRRAGEKCDCQSGNSRGWCCYVNIPGRGKWSYYPFPCMVTLQKLANHMALLLPSTTDDRDKQRKDLENLQLALPDRWKDLDRIKGNILSLSQREFCGKWKVLKRLLDFWYSNGDKVLVFSHSVRLLRLLKSLFDVDGTKYNFSYLDGAMPYAERAKAVADFNSDPKQFVFLISTKAGGVGLNITSANKVVVVDPNWNPAYDLQAQDRAYRIGQTRDVEVFRLISSGTIEEIVYARQIYKQQQANIGYNASLERRYFKGVMDTKGKKGELFGLESLFTFQENGLLLRDIINKTNVAEVKAGVKALDFQADSDLGLDEDEDDDSDMTLSLEDGPSQKQMKEIASIITSGGRPKKLKRTGPDPINAILEKAGVLYTHENSEVIGKSRIEAELSRKAIEVQNDIEFGRKTAFDLSQSQPGLGVELSDSEKDLSGTAPDGGELKITYRYKPDEEVRRRQFCSMAKMEGYDDPTEFALVVEEATQDERRGLLDRFYKMRRRELARNFKRQV